MYRVTKRGQMSAIGWNYFVPLIIAVVVLALVLISYFALRDSGNGALDFFKNLFRLGKP